MSIKAKKIKERLEGSYRLIRIKRIKLGFFLLQIILASLVGGVVAMLMGARFDPFFFPVDMFLFIFLLFMFFMAAEVIYFKGLEIKYTRSKSRRFLIARNSIRNSGAILAIAVLCVVLLMLPMSQEFISDTYSLSDEGNIVSGGEGNFTFDSQDSFGFMRASTLTVEVTNGEVDLRLFVGINGLWSPSLSAPNSATHSVDYYTSSIETFHVQLNNTGAVNASYTWSVENEVSSYLSLYIPALGIMFIIVEMVSIMIMYPLRETYASSSIYSKKYVAKKEAGVYLATEKKKTIEEEKEDELLESTLDIEMPLPLPPPPPVEAAPKAELVPEKEELVTKMGVVEEDLIEEEDIACPTCGEMNSSHATMCFLCGNPMVAKVKEEVPLDPTGLFIKAVELSQAGKHGEAIERYDAVLMKDRASEDALLGKGTELHKQGKWGSAIQHINTALKVNPNNIDALLLKADILSDRDKLDKALVIYKQVLKIDPDNAYARSKMEETSEEVALEDAEEVIGQFMCLPGIGMARATILYDSGFTGFEKLKAASEEDLAGVNGISERLAKKIKKSLDAL